jgi:hypothetical protein
MPFAEKRVYKFTSKTWGNRVEDVQKLDDTQNAIPKAYATD